MSDRTPLSTGNDAPGTPTRGDVPDVRYSKNPLLPKNYNPELNRGYGTANNRGMELALTVVFMTGLGFIADKIIGTTPLFTIVLSVLGFVGISVKLWLGYDLEMKAHEEGAVWNRHKETGA